MGAYLLKLGWPGVWLLGIGFGRGGACVCCGDAEIGFVAFAAGGPP